MGDNPPAIDFDSWGYSTEWSIGANEGINRRDQPEVETIGEIDGVTRSRMNLIMMHPGQESLVKDDEGQITIV